MVTRLEPHQLPERHRIWTGNDEKGRHHHEMIPRSQTPLSVHLSWKVASDAPARFIGCYELDMTTLLAAGYIREDGPNDVRLRFVHADDDGIYIQSRETGPRFRVDTF